MATKKEIEEIIKETEKMDAYMTRPYKYKGFLPSELKKHHVYYIDGGHGIKCVLNNHLAEALKTDMRIYLVPVPVKYVLEKGYRIINGYVVCDAPYDKFVGLIVEEKYREYE